MTSLGQKCLKKGLFRLLESKESRLVIVGWVPPLKHQIEEKEEEVRELRQTKKKQRSLARWLPHRNHRSPWQRISEIPNQSQKRGDKGKRRRSSRTRQKKDKWNPGRVAPLLGQMAAPFLGDIEAEPGARKNGRTKGTNKAREVPEMPVPVRQEERKQGPGMKS